MLLSEINQSGKVQTARLQQCNELEKEKDGDGNKVVRSGVMSDDCREKTERQ